MNDVEWVESVVMPSGPWGSYWVSGDRTSFFVREYYSTGRIVIEDYRTGKLIAGPFDTLDAAKAAYLMIAGEQSDG